MRELADHVRLIGKTAPHTERPCPVANDSKQEEQCK
jgi:hypothetical protein